MRTPSQRAIIESGQATAQLHEEAVQVYGEDAPDLGFAPLVNDGERVPAEEVAANALANPRINASPVASERGKQALRKIAIVPDEEVIVPDEEIKPDPEFDPNWKLALPPQGNSEDASRALALADRAGTSPEQAAASPTLASVVDQQEAAAILALSPQLNTYLGQFRLVAQVTRAELPSLAFVEALLGEAVKNPIGAYSLARTALGDAVSRRVGGMLQGLPENYRKADDYWRQTAQPWFLGKPGDTEPPPAARALWKGINEAVLDAYTSLKVVGPNAQKQAREGLALGYKIAGVALQNPALASVADVLGDEQKFDAALSAVTDSAAEVLPDPDGVLLRSASATLGALPGLGVLTAVSLVGGPAAGALVFAQQAFAPLYREINAQRDEHGNWLHTEERAVELARIGAGAQAVVGYFLGQGWAKALAPKSLLDAMGETTGTVLTRFLAKSPSKFDRVYSAVKDGLSAAGEAGVLMASQGAVNNMMLQAAEGREKINGSHLWQAAKHGFSDSLLLLPVALVKPAGRLFAEIRGEAPQVHDDLLTLAASVHAIKDSQFARNNPTEARKLLRSLLGEERRTSFVDPDALMRAATDLGLNPEQIGRQVAGTAEWQRARDTGTHAAVPTEKFLVDLGTNGMAEKLLAHTKLKREGRTVAEQVRAETDATNAQPVRFYHGGIPGEGPRWLTPDRAYAEGYAAKTEGATVQYVDIPGDHPLLTKAFDDSGLSARAPFMAFEAPAELAKKLQPLEGDLSKTQESDPLHVQLSKTWGHTPEFWVDALKKMGGTSREWEKAIGNDAQLGDVVAEMGRAMLPTMFSRVARAMGGRPEQWFQEAQRDPQLLATLRAMDRSLRPPTENAMLRQKAQEAMETAPLSTIDPAQYRKAEKQHQKALEAAQQRVINALGVAEQRAQKGAATISEGADVAIHAVDRLGRRGHGITPAAADMFAQGAGEKVQRGQDAAVKATEKTVEAGGYAQEAEAAQGKREQARHYAREAEKVQKEADGHIEKIDQLAGRRKAVYQGDEALGAAHDLLMYGLGKRAQPPDLSVLNALRDRVAFDSDLLAEISMNPRDVDSLSISELRTVRTALENIDHLAKAQRTVTLGEQARGVGAWVESLKRRFAGAPETNPGRMAALANDMEMPYNLLAPLGDLGVAVGEGFRDARNNRNATRKEIFEPFYKAVVEDQPKALKATGGQPLEGFNGEVRTRSELWYAALQMGSDTGARGLLDGLRNAQERAEIREARATLPASEFAAVEARIDGGVEARIWKALDQIKSKQEWDYIKLVWERTAALWRLIAANERQMHGVAPDAIGLRPVMTPHGELQGGYVPRSWRELVQGQAPEGANYGGEATKLSTTITEPKYLTERVRVEAEPNLDFNQLTRHFLKATHDVAFDQFLANVKPIFDHPEAQALIKEKLGASHYDHLISTLSAWARGGAQRPTSETWEIFRIARALTRNLVGAAFKYNPGIAIADIPHAISVAVGTGLGPNALTLEAAMYGATKALDPAAWELGMTLSKELPHRWADYGRKLESMLADLQGKPEYDNARHGYMMMHMSDAYSSQSVWHGAFMQAESRGLGHLGAIEFADNMVRKALPPLESMEQSAFGRDKGALSMLFFVRNYSNTIFNIGRSLMWEGRAKIWSEQPGFLGKAQTSAEVAARMAGLLLGAHLAGSYFMGKGRKDNEDYGDWAIRNSVGASLSWLPATDFVSALGELATESGRIDWFDSQVQNSPLLTIAQSFMKAGQVGFSNKDTNQKIEAALDLAAKLRGIPTFPIRSAFGTYRMVTGQTKKLRRPKGVPGYLDFPLNGDRRNNTYLTDLDIALMGD